MQSQPEASGGDHPVRQQPASPNESAPALQQPLPPHPPQEVYHGHPERGCGESSASGGSAGAAEVLHGLQAGAGVVQQGCRTRSGPLSASTLHSSDWGVDNLNHMGVHPSASAATVAAPSPSRPSIASPVLGRSPGSPQRTAVSHLRNIEQALRATRSDAPPELPEDFPDGPYASLQMHFDQIKRWAEDPSRGEGAFKVRQKENKESSKKRGAYMRLVCHRSGQPPAGTSIAAASGAAPSSLRALGQQSKGNKEGRRRGSIRCNCPWSLSLEVVAGPAGGQQ